MEVITLDEAIEIMTNIAEEHFKQGGEYNKKYAAVTAQVAVWLTEYRELRRDHVSASEKSLQPDGAGIAKAD